MVSFNTVKKLSFQALVIYYDSLPLADGYRSWQSNLLLGLYYGFDCFWNALLQIWLTTPIFNLKIIIFFIILHFVRFKFLTFKKHSGFTARKFNWTLQKLFFLFVLLMRTGRWNLNRFTISLCWLDIFLYEIILPFRFPVEPTICNINFDILLEQIIHFQLHAFLYLPLIAKNQIIHLILAVLLTFHRVLLLFLYLAHPYLLNIIFFILLFLQIQLFYCWFISDLTLPLRLRGTLRSQLIVRFSFE